MDDYIGMIKIFAGNFAPRGWAFCNGATLQIRQYTAVYSILGTYYGGDGQTTFKLPNLGGQTLIGTGTSAHSGTTYDLGEQGGSENGAMGLINMPVHNHPVAGSVTIMSNADAAETTDPSGAYFGPSATQDYNTTPSADMKALTTSSMAVAIAGSGSPFDKRMLYTTVNYIICIEGDFPPRN